MVKINVLSPYHIFLTEANLDSAKIEIYIYTGTQVTSRGAIDYTIEQNAISDKITFEISELVKDFIDVSFDGTYTSDTIWVDYQITRTVSATPQSPETIVLLTGFYGYGYFNEGVNPTLSGGLLQSNTDVCKLDDNPITIPIFQDEVNQVTYSYKGEDIFTEAITPVLTDDKIIRYISVNANGIDDYRERVEADGGTFENSSCLEAFFRDHLIFPVDTIYLDTDTGVVVINVKNIEECKYEPIKLTFLNKFGAKQSVWFFKNNVKRMRVKGDDYKSNILVDGSYNTFDHQRSVIRKTANESLTINSGFYPESYNEIFSEILQSEFVWIEYLNQVHPVVVSTSSFTNKTSLTDGLINYTFDLTFAYDKINNVL